MVAIVPTVGRIVLYSLSDHDASLTMEHPPGAVFPAIITKVSGEEPTSKVNLRVFVDSPDEPLWVQGTEVEEDKGSDRLSRPIHTPGRYHWMPYQKAVAGGAPPTLHAKKG